MATKMDKARVVVLLALAAGSSKRAAAGKAGIAYRTLNRWQQEEEFADAIEVATGQGRDVYESILREAAAKDWRAALAAYEIIYEGGVRGGSRKGTSADDLAPVEAPEPLDVTDDDARQRVAKVLSILHDALGSREPCRRSSRPTCGGSGWSRTDPVRCHPRSQAPGRAQTASNDARHVRA